MGECVGSGDYYSRVARVEAKPPTGKTWPWTRSCVPCTSWAVGFQRRAERQEPGVSYSIYELKNYSKVSTVYIREDKCEAMTGKAGEPHTVRKRNYR